MKYFFVEGNDDELLLNCIVKDKVKCKIIQYARRKPEKIDAFIESIESMGYDYVFLADLDEKNYDTRTLELMNKYRKLSKEKIYYAIQEIEAWILAGVTEEAIDRYRIKTRFLSNTENITKERFESIFKKTQKDTIITVKSYIIDNFDIKQAVIRNNSFKDFIEQAI